MVLFTNRKRSPVADPGAEEQVLNVLGLVITFDLVEYARQVAEEEQAEEASRKQLLGSKLSAHADETSAATTSTAEESTCELQQVPQSPVKDETSHSKQSKKSSKRSSKKGSSHKTEKNKKSSRRSSKHASSAVTQEQESPEQAPASPTKESETNKKSKSSSKEGTETPPPSDSQTKSNNKSSKKKESEALLSPTKESKSDLDQASKHKKSSKQKTNKDKEKDLLDKKSKQKSKEDKKSLSSSSHHKAKSKETSKKSKKKKQSAKKDKKESKQDKRKKPTRADSGDVSLIEIISLDSTPEEDIALAEQYAKEKRGGKRPDGFKRAHSSEEIESLDGSSRQPCGIDDLNDSASEMGFFQNETLENFSIASKSGIISPTLDAPLSPSFARLGFGVFKEGSNFSSPKKFHDELVLSPTISSELPLLGSPVTLREAFVPLSSPSCSSKQSLSSNSGISAADMLNALPSEGDDDPVQQPSNEEFLQQRQEQKSVNNLLRSLYLSQTSFCCSDSSENED